MSFFGGYDYWAPLPRNNPYEDRFTRSIAASQLFFDQLQSTNYVAGATGFHINSSGTAEFASGVTLGPGAITIAADIQSSNWAGGVPETGSSAGYFLDYSTGNTQFGGNMYIKASLDVDGNVTTGGTITANGNITSNGTITGNAQWNMNDTINFGGSGGGVLQTDSSIPYVKIYEWGVSSGGRILFERNASDNTGHRIDATDDLLKLQGRLASGQLNGMKMEMGSYGYASSTHASYREWRQGASLGNAIYEKILPKTLGGFEYYAGSDWNKTNLGTGTPVYQWLAEGDAQGFLFDADPATTEYHTQWLENSTTTIAAIVSEGFLHRNNDAYLPYWANFTASDGSPASASTWTTIGSNNIAWDHTGTNRAVRIAMGYWCFAQNTGASNRLMAIRGQVSFDGGSTWNSGTESHGTVGAAAGGATKMPLGRVHIANGTATGDVLVRFQAYRDGTITGNFRNISMSTQIMGLV